MKSDDSQCPNKTDRIAFDKAPKNYKDLYDADAFPQELQNETYFYGFGVGLYERLGIDKRIIPFLKIISISSMMPTTMYETLTIHYMSMFMSMVSYKDKIYRIRSMVLRLLSCNHWSIQNKQMDPTHVAE